MSGLDKVTFYQLPESDNHLISEGYPDFWQDVILLDDKYFPFPWNHSGWQDLMQPKGPQHLLGICHGDQSLYGLILFELEKLDLQASLHKIVVAPRYRGQKWGSRLLQEALYRLKDEGFVKFHLQVEVDNLTAISLYKSHGFKVIHTQKSYYSNGRSAHIMSL